jgi:hypothetical protein
MGVFFRTLWCSNEPDKVRRTCRRNLANCASLPDTFCQTHQFRMSQLVAAALLQKPAVQTVSLLAQDANKLAHP